MIPVSIWSAKDEQGSESWKRREIRESMDVHYESRSSDGQIAAQGILGCVHEKDQEVSQPGEL
jgi:hypothetical protein